MDLLALPAGSQSPLDKAPLIPHHRWDGKNFMTFGHRKARLKWVPYAYRIGDGAPDVAFINPSLRPPEESDEEHSFFQAWLFFGLLAEVFCLNEQADGSRLMPADEAARELDGLYQDFVVVRDGKQYIAGAKLLDHEVGDLLAGCWASDPGGIEARLRYLGDCAIFSHGVVLKYRGSSKLEASTHNIICALGEILSTTVSAVAWGSGFNSPEDSNHLTVALPWGADYIVPGGAMESRMLQKGWCRSDLERVRRVYPRLNTQHYLSCLPGLTSGLDHAGCSQHKCVAAQIVPGKYGLSHASPDCQCTTIGIDVEEVMQILKNTESFPVLTVQYSGTDLDSMVILVEEYVAEKPYVALSHVWAHGLGNPFENSLHRCQIARVARMIGDLSNAQETGSTTLRVWIDTLCCPVDLGGKVIALQRMATVYRQAQHVLVLDLAIASVESKGAHPALLGLTITACSTWMRRLWTLQEGMLPNSVYFQFADGARALEVIAADLFKIGILDARYMAIYQDIQADAIRLGILVTSDPSAEATLQVLQEDSIQRRLWLLQASLAFRSVSVADDEPLCIETLLGLEPRRVAEIQGRDERMAHIWTSLAQAQAIPPKIIFFVDESLPLPGFGWAPRTLLHAGADSHLVNLDLAHRFDSLLPFTQNRDPTKPAYQPATLTDSGLKVTFPGFSVKLRPWRPNGSLEGWVGLATGVEDAVVCYHAASGKWYNILDNYRSQVVNQWPAEKRQEYDQSNPWPLCKEIRQGNVVLIRDSTADSPSLVPSLMVRIREDEKNSSVGDVLEVEKLRTVTLIACDATYCRFFDTLAELSKEAALRLVSMFGDGRQTGTSAENVVSVMQELTMQRLDSDPAFEDAFRTLVGFLNKEKAWLALVMWLPFNMVLEDLPEDQTWIVDKRNN